MLRFASSLLAAILFCFLAVLAYASVGTVPQNGQGLVDGTFINGITQGRNFTYQYGITAAGTNQATATQLPSGMFLLEIDTAGSGGATGVALPSCLAGTRLSLFDSTAYTVDVYPSVSNNPVTAAQDTINNSTSTSQTTYTAKTYSCAQNGKWSAQ